MRKRITIAVTAVALFATVGLTSAPAFADETPHNDPGKVAAVGPGAPQTGVDTIYLTDSGSNTAAGVVQPLVTTACLSTCTLQDSAQRTIQPGAQAALLTTGFTTTFVSEYNDVNFKSGSSYGDWLGNTPVNATKMYLTDSFSVAGIGGVTISVPGGVGWTVGATTATWQTGASNLWQMSHSFSNVRFYGVILSSTEDVKAEADFGGQAFSVAT